jgi:beta-lactam-binding protein with PASTA domain
MARTVPADLEDALASAPAARERFWSLPPEQKDAWVAYVERARVPGARRRRVREAVRRLGGAPAAVAVEEGGGAPVALPREDWSIWLVGLALLAGLAAFLVWLTVFRNDDTSKPTAVVVSAKTNVPKVTGIRYQAAQFQLKEAKLTSSLTQKASAKPKGIVVRQTPVDGKTVPQGTQVVLVVSKGPPGVKMPDVTGMAAADAVKALQERRLVPTIEQKTSTEAPGTVLAQDPKPGKRAKPGSTVTLQVAKGRSSVQVPSVVGRTEEDAGVALRQAGLTSASVQVPSSQPPGTVVAQNPPAGAKVAKGARVRLNVSKGQAQTTTAATTTAATTTAATTTTTSAPSGGQYAGMKLRDAAQQAADGQQQVVVQYVSSPKPVGTVLASSQSGSKVRLQVSTGPHPKPAAQVPDVSGEDQPNAQRDLHDAGFTSIPITWPDPSSDGLVVAQSPDAGASVPQGLPIVIYVGTAGGG